jgi:hypothetical protein
MVLRLLMINKLVAAIEAVLAVPITAGVKTLKGAGDGEMLLKVPQ